MCHVIYSFIAVSIILLFMYRYANAIQCNEIKKEMFENNKKLMYGDTKILLSESPITYSRIDKTNTLLIPNSKSAYRHLIDYDEYKCKSDKNFEIVNTIH